MDPLHVLLIEDNPGDAGLVRLALAQATGGPRADLVHVPTLEQGLAALAAREFDVVLLDLTLPDSVGLASLPRLDPARVPVVVLTGMEDDDLAAAAVRAGAEDYVVKGTLGDASLLRVLRHAIERHERAETARAPPPGLLADVRRHLDLLEAEHRALARVLSRAGGAPAADGIPLAPGAIVAERYRIVRPLGRGAVGATFLSRDETLGRQVCLKVLHHHRARDASIVADFLREARTAARLSHPNVVGVHDFGYAGDLPYLVLEYADGGTLADHIAERGPTTIAEAVAFEEGILDGLAYMHARGIVHGDLKPANVLLARELSATSDPERPLDARQLKPKLADFGLARDASSPGPSTTHVGLDEPLLPRGTPAYMSPEVARGGTPTAASDLYAAGAILHELLAGATYLDFGGLTATGVRRAILQEPPRALPESVPAPLRAVVARALAKEAPQRFASTREMLDALSPARAESAPRSRAPQRA